MTQWSFTAIGQPVSWDAAYRTGRVTVKRRGRVVLNVDGTPRVIHRPILTEEAEKWRNDVVVFARLAKPSRWRPEGQVRVIFDLRLAADMDCDNAEKLALDGLARAIDYDDIHFLVCTRTKSHGRSVRDACVIVTVDDDVAHP